MRHMDLTSLNPYVCVACEAVYSSYGLGKYRAG